MRLSDILNQCYEKTIKDKHDRKMVKFYDDFIISLMKEHYPGQSEDWYEIELSYLYGILYI